jgi:hypothetical protein
VRTPISQEFNPRSLKYRCNHLFRGILVMVRTPTLKKKKIKFSSYIRKLRVEQLQSHI